VGLQNSQRPRSEILLFDNNDPFTVLQFFVGLLCKEMRGEGHSFGVEDLCCGFKTEVLMEADGADEDGVGVSECQQGAVEHLVCGGRCGGVGVLEDQLFTDVFSELCFGVEEIGFDGRVCRNRYFLFELML
jgi:hypothetical protein